MQIHANAIAYNTGTYTRGTYIIQVIANNDHEYAFLVRIRRYAQLQFSNSLYFAISDIGTISVLGTDGRSKRRMWFCRVSGKAPYTPPPRFKSDIWSFVRIWRSRWRQEVAVMRCVATVNDKDSEVIVLPRTNNIDWPST